MTFLSAKWQNLLMINYLIEPQLLQKYLPYKTELDSFDQRYFVSLVGFRFVETKVLGIKFPFHTNFEEVNLRFYVRFKENNQWKRGVVFIKEIVPKPIITFIANTLYNENYATHPCRHSIQSADNQLLVEYSWKSENGWNTIKANAESNSKPILEGSEEEFITEHYWGYAKKNNLQTTEYQVEHPRWNIHPIIDYHINCDFEGLYGTSFSFLKHSKPSSIFLADGSAISVLKGKTIK